MFSSADRLYMRRALELAQIAKGMTSPNPMVGCVIVHNDLIIGEGYHHKAGEPHAEVMAYRSVVQKELMHESDVYVTLEPCAHYGKTPPCAELLAKLLPRRVVIAMKDPFPEVAGKGIEILKRANIEVQVGLLSDESRALNKAFLSVVEKKRPYIILKWAETSNGFLDSLRIESEHTTPLVLSSMLDARLVHKLRSECDAILIGKRTAILDNPSLTNRLWYGRSPRAFILTDTNQIPMGLRLMTKENAATVICSEHVPEFGLHNVIDVMTENNVSSLIVEGGAEVLNLFLKNGCYDEIRRYVSPLNIAIGVRAPKLPF